MDIKKQVLNFEFFVYLGQGKFYNVAADVPPPRLIGGGFRSGISVGVIISR